MICNAGDIVIVPFPFVDSAHAKRRPAVVLSRRRFNETHRHTVLAMITTGKGFSWKSDMPIASLESTGLPLPSVVRMKLFTLDNRLLQDKLGRLHGEEKRMLKQRLRTDVLGIQ